MFGCRKSATNDFPKRGMNVKTLENFSAGELRAFAEEAKKYYEELKARKLDINMARGKPCSEQLNLSDGLFNLDLSRCGYKAEDGTDCRNYGLLCGIPECRRLFGEVFGVEAKNVIACGSSSLNLMFDYFCQCYTHGACGSKPWSQVPGFKIIAAVPGYDRHFAVAQYFGAEFVNVKMTAEGPDMDAVEELVKDPTVKGMFCVPKYSNPDGITYSDRTVERLASMKTAADDFRVIWDEAYIIHDLYDEKDELANVFDAAKRYGTEDRFVAFASTSKITYPGAGVSAIAASDANIGDIKKRLTVQIISYDKVNQLRHSFFYKNLDDLKAQMAKHAEILRPKFAKMAEVLHKRLGGLGIALWTDPKGGYFISLNVDIGSAKHVGKLCAECGVTLTGVGATYPYGVDPDDANIRLAPSCPTVDEIEAAAEVICVAVKIAAAEKLLGEKE